MYSRLAYSSVEKQKEAVECFEKALELEPENESYKSNLTLAKEKLNTTGSPGPGKEKTEEGPSFKSINCLNLRAIKVKRLQFYH